MANNTNKRRGSKLPTFVLLNPPEKAALQKLALETERSVGYYIRQAVVKFLVEAGLLEKPKTSGHSKVAGAARLVLALFSLAVASSASAQDLPTGLPTMVKGHAMGESSEVFFSIAWRPDAMHDCQQVGSDKKAARKLKLDFKLCQGILASQSGRVNTTDPKFGPFPSKAILDGGKLVEVDLHFEKEFAEILPQLTEKYGKPADFHTEQMVNGYGATFEVARASWMMPDGTIISAIESIWYSEVIGSYRVSDVSFTAKDEVSRDQANRKNTPNSFN